MLQLELMGKILLIYIRAENLKEMFTKINLTQMVFGKDWIMDYKQVQVSNLANMFSD